MSVKLYIKDNTDGTIHEYGTDKHDSLELQYDGSIHYVNIQNLGGTKDFEYEFCFVDGTNPLTRQDYIKNGVDPILDIAGDYYEKEGE